MRQEKIRSPPTPSISSARRSRPLFHLPPTVTPLSAQLRLPINPTAALRCLQALSDRHLVRAWSSGMTCISTPPAMHAPLRPPEAGLRCPREFFLRRGMGMGGWFPTSVVLMLGEGTPESFTCHVANLCVALAGIPGGGHVVRRGRGLAFWRVVVYILGDLYCIVLYCVSIVRSVIMFQLIVASLRGR